jgi:hypothetical protein
MAPAARVGFGLLVPTLTEFEPCGLDRLREAARLGDAGAYYRSDLRP